MENGNCSSLVPSFPSHLLTNAHSYKAVLCSCSKGWRGNTRYTVRTPLPHARSRRKKTPTPLAPACYFANFLVPLFAHGFNCFDSRLPNLPFSQQGISSRKLPPITTVHALAERRHGLICRSCLCLTVRDHFLLALPALELLGYGFFHLGNHGLVHILLL